MRDLNEIVDRNVRKIIREAEDAAAREDPPRKLTVNHIGGRMGEAMGLKADSGRKALERLLAGKSQWTANYIQAFGAAMGKSPEELISLEGQPIKVSEATVAQALYAGMNHRMTRAQQRQVLRRLHRQLDHPPLFELVQRLTDRLLDAEDRAEAYEAAIDLIRRSDAWDKRRDLRGKKVSDK